MSVTKCKACKQQVGKNAEICPNCGEPQKRKSIGCMGAIGIVVLAIAVGSVFMQQTAERAPKKVLTAEEQKAEDLFFLQQIGQRHIEDTIKQSLKDPDSYERIDVQREEQGDGSVYVVVKYRAKNSFGGFVVNRVAATVAADGSTISDTKSLDE